MVLMEGEYMLKFVNQMALDNIHHYIDIPQTRHIMLGYEVGKLSKDHHPTYAINEYDKVIQVAHRA